MLYDPLMAELVKFFEDLVRANPDDFADRARQFLNEYYMDEEEEIVRFGPMMRGLPTEDYADDGALLKPLLRLDQYTAAMREIGSTFTIAHYRVYKYLAMSTFPDFELSEIDIEIPLESVQLYELVPTGIRSSLHYRTPQKFKSAVEYDAYSPPLQMTRPLIATLKHHIHNKDWRNLVRTSFGDHPQDTFDVARYPDLLPFEMNKIMSSGRDMTMYELMIMNLVSWLAIRRYNFRHNPGAFEALVARDLSTVLAEGLGSTNPYSGAHARSLASRYRARS